MAKRSDIRPAASPVQAEFARAVALHQGGQVDEAERVYRAILKSQHRHFDAARLLGIIFLQRGDAAAAEAQLARALKYPPGDPANPNLGEAYNYRGVALTRLRRFADALDCFERALAIRPGHVTALSNRAAALLELGRLDECFAASEALIAAQPRFAEAHHTRARVLYGWGRFTEAIAGYAQAVALQKDFHDAFYSRGHARLLTGDYAAGWLDCEHRLLTAEYKGAPVLPASVTSADFRDKRVMLGAEQGIGDEIMFASMIPDLMRDAGSVTVECDRRLCRLYERSFPGIVARPRDMTERWKAADYDHVFTAGSLGRLYRNTLADFPQRDSFLTPDPAAVAQWSARLAGLGEGRRIGISWKGGIDRTRRGTRSIPLEQWAPVFALPSVHFVSLQYGEVKDEVARAVRALGKPITCFEKAEIDDFDALAGLVSSLDLVVTVQTALVHLCGALGKTCKVFVPYIPEWRYGATGDRMPWYRSVRLYRQDQPDDWSGPLARVAADLA